MRQPDDRDEEVPVKIRTGTLHFSSACLNGRSGMTPELHGGWTCEAVYRRKRIINHWRTGVQAGEGVGTDLAVNDRRDVAR